MRTFAGALLLALALPTGAGDVRAQTTTADGIAALLRQLELVVQSGSSSGYEDLLAGSADPGRAREFSEAELHPGVTRATVHERDRGSLPGTLPGNGYRLNVEIFVEYGPRAHLATWRLDIRRVPDSDQWRIADQDRLTSVENLYRLSLDPGKQFTARNLTIAAEDIELSLVEGLVFVADTDQGVTGLVLLGRGNVRFHPAPTTEKGQLKIFCGADTLDTRFDAAFVRINPADFESRIATRQLVVRPVNPADFRRADEVFLEEVTKSFGLELGDLTRDSWSLLPGINDFVAEIRTRRFGTLTYARSSGEAEDITLFDRKRHRNIALYQSAERLARRGRFYNEDELADIDVVDYNIDLAVVPGRQWLEGRTELRLKVKSFVLGTLTLRLADQLVVQSIASDQFGRLSGFRVRNQNSIVINLPTPVQRDTELTLTITYAGRLEPQAAERETLTIGQARSTAQEEAPVVLAEPNFLYSNRSYWYPQATMSDYATARIRLTVPIAYDCVASGDLDPETPFIIGPTNDPVQARKVYQFSSLQPLRYLAFIVSKFTKSDVATIGPVGDEGGDRAGDLPLTGVSYGGMTLAIQANPRQVRRGHDLTERAADIAEFYSSLVGDYPYPSFTVALVEDNLPGGHSPGYFAVLNQPLPTSPFVWRNDPAAFSNYPEFFLAHEVAHQWWGQGVGWGNYHEQWLSEGISQYFAALYAQRHRGDEVFAGVLRQLRRWAMDQSGQGPVYLGYRLGHIRNEGRVFRALVYNKGAAVLHMLRRLVGDEAFFRGIRRFYRVWRFRKAGTEDLRHAMETEAGRPLDRFFERWIYGSTLPRLKFTYRVEPGAAGQEVVLHVEQIGEDVFDLPLTVTLQYADRKTVDVLVPVTDRVVDMRVALTGTLRSAEARTDEATLAEIVKK